jgi:hypothetical protein
VTGAGLSGYGGGRGIDLCKPVDGVGSLLTGTNGLE